jgi:hypothetical protein
MDNRIICQKCTKRGKFGWCVEARLYVARKAVGCEKFVPKKPIKREEA